jgi:hypothetical protein
VNTFRVFGFVQGFALQSIGGDDSVLSWTVDYADILVRNTCLFPFDSLAMRLELYRQLLNNQLGGTIPSTIGQLTALEQL